MQISKESLSLELVHSPSSHQHKMISDLLSPTTSISLLSGDYIGMESCDDVVNDTALSGGSLVDRQDSYSEKLRGKREERLAMKRKEFPPPIPLLARTENLPSHMPWILKRHYTSDGRLILTEEKVRYHEYFMAHRSNGRLRLQLVPLDGGGGGGVWAPPHPHPPSSVCCDEEECECDEDDDHDDNVDAYDDENDDGDNDYEKDEEGDNHEVEESSNGGNNSSNSINGGGGGSSSSSSSSSNNNGKCLNFNSVGRGSPCIFGVPVPAIRQVLS